MVSDLGRTLHHSDVRVKRAAVRALAKIGGTAAERELAGPFTKMSRRPRPRSFNLWCRCALAALSSISALFSKNGVRNFPYEFCAADAIGQLGSADGLPYLSEILRRRGRIGGEPAELRMAAADALNASSADGAREIVASVLESEPRGTVRDLILKSLQRARPRAES